MQEFQFNPVTFPPEAEETRANVRAFLADELKNGGFKPRANCWVAGDTGFSERCGAAGFIGMTWPKEYGGHERSALERYVVIEEMLAAGAPVGAHWVVDRQSGPQLIAHSTPEICKQILPRVTEGKSYFAIGMSEPDSGSDLASVRTRATKVEGGWRITGTKVWTSYAHMADYIILLARSAPLEDDRHAGLTQFIIDMSKDGVSTSPIKNLHGGGDFNEVVFDAYFQPDGWTVGGEGNGWKMVTGELAYERSGPERFLSTYTLLREFVRTVGDNPDAASARAVGRMVSHLSALRHMSTSIAGMLEEGLSPNLEAAVVKDLGNKLEKEIPEIVRLLAPRETGFDSREDYEQALAISVLEAPSFALRGGTREILRGIIAKGLGLR
ncbi:MAG TPA: acyl-CoA dehydrogenase [Sneathiellales bacterium]|nr:acyl-CoA dehydrogenase [Sneathiellales bacterium]